MFHFFIKILPRGMSKKTIPVLKNSVAGLMTIAFSICYYDMIEEVPTTQSYMKASTNIIESI
jgi:hypothetical protein